MLSVSLMSREQSNMNPASGATSTTRQVRFLPGYAEALHRSLYTNWKHEETR